MPQNNKHIKILFVEDLPTDAEMAQREIKKEQITFTALVVDTETEFRKALSDFNPDIIISDYSMPNFDGMKALKITRAKDPIIPFILLTGSMNEETAVECMKAGANDYVLKEKIKRLPFAVLEALEKHKARIEKENMENQLRESEVKYRTLIQNSADAIYLLYNRKFELINPAFEKLFGYTIKDLNQPGFDFLRLVAPESKNFIEERLQNIRDGKEVSPQYEFTAITKNGEKKEVEASVSYLDFKGAKATQGVIRDVTKRKAIEKRLRLISRAIEQSPVAIEITDSEGTIEYINPAFEKITGYLSEEILGQNPRTLQSGHHNKAFYEKMWDTICSGKDWKGELRNKKKSGELYWEDAVISPIFNAKGTITHFVAVKEDVTEKKKMIEDLITSKEKAEESDRLKSAFLANVSHEIRTPMNGIMGFADLLKKPGLTSDKQQEFIDIIKKSGTRMLNLITDLIDISRIESGELQINLQRTNINKHLTELHEFFNTEAEEKGIQLNVHCALPEKDADINTDPEKLNAVITNLLKNAVKFTKQGTIDFGYEWHNEHITFFVKDTGIGIPENKTEAIFNRFVQVDMDLTRDYEGSGLGLSISKAYVEMLGGEIWLTSKEHEGTQIYFSLPLTDFENEALLNEPKQNINNSVSIPNFNNKTILIAEDDNLNYILLEEMLSDKGINIIHMKNGKEAVELCQINKKIDMVLMDIKMPVMDGHTAAKIIKEHNPGLPIIAQSAYAMDHEIRKFSTTFDEYITKPIKESELLILISKVVHNKSL